MKTHTTKENFEKAKKILRKAATRIGKLIDQRDRVNRMKFTGTTHSALIRMALIREFDFMLAMSTLPTLKPSKKKAKHKFSPNAGGGKKDA